MKLGRQDSHPANPQPHTAAKPLSVHVLQLHAYSDLIRSCAQCQGWLRALHSEPSHVAFPCNCALELEMSRDMLMKAGKNGKPLLAMRTAFPC